MTKIIAYSTTLHPRTRHPQEPTRSQQPLLEGAGDLVRVPKGLLKGIYRLPQRDL